MKWMLNKWCERQRRWYDMLKSKKEDVDNEIGVETIVHCLRYIYIYIAQLPQIPQIHSTTFNVYTNHFYPHF